MLAGSGRVSFVLSARSQHRDLGNYVQFDNVCPRVDHSTATHRGGTDGIGIAGLQLEQVPEPGSAAMLAAGAGIDRHDASPPRREVEFA
jgi:hypothetical protein